MIYVLLSLLVVLIVYQEFCIRKLENQQAITYSNLLSLAQGLNKKGIIKLFIEGEEQ